MSLAAQMERFKAKAVSKMDQIPRLIIEEVGGRVVMELSPVGDPTTWKTAPGANYRPGNFRGNWFFGIDAPNGSTHDGVGILTVNNLGAMPAKTIGHKLYISNSVPYAVALEYGHSFQAPAGIVAVIEPELSDIAISVAKRVGAA